MVGSFRYQLLFLDDLANRLGHEVADGSSLGHAMMKKDNTWSRSGGLYGYNVTLKQNVDPDWAVTWMK